jgi:hypothetical protein
VTGAFDRSLPSKHQTPQRVGHFDVEQMRRVKLLISNSTNGANFASAIAGVLRDTAA